MPAQAWLGQGWERSALSEAVRSHHHHPIHGPSGIRRPAIIQRPQSGRQRRQAGDQAHHRPTPCPSLRRRESGYHQVRADSSRGPCLAPPFPPAAAKPPSCNCRVFAECCAGTCSASQVSPHILQKAHPFTHPPPPLPAGMSSPPQR